VGRLGTWAKRARKLNTELYVLYLAYKDPRVPWYGKLLTAVVVAYAFSPVDLIPDFIPVLGYLDDIIILPLGINLAMRMIPQQVLEEHREHARQRLKAPVNWFAAAAIIAVWIMVFIFIIIKMLSSI